MEVINKAVTSVNERFQNTPPAKLITGSAVTALVARWLYRTLTRPDLKDVYEANLMRCLRMIPSVQKRLDGEMKQAKRNVSSIFHRYEGETIHNQLPAKSRSASAVLAEATEINKLNHNWRDGTVSGAVYHGGEELTDMLVKVYQMYHWTNPLHPDLFPSLKKMESEVVAMVLDMFHAPEGSGGVFTSGGTESILMAVKCYRDWAKETKGISEPNLVAPVTAHAAFNKACGYFGVYLKSIPVDPETGRADPALMKAAIDSNTIAVVASAPCYSVGCMDPVVELSEIALKRGIGLHVDSCLGGFMIPFMEEAGFKLKPFDFRVPGVTSISCDTHKYGFSPKGSSVVMYRTEQLRRYQYFVAPKWPGGIYTSPSFSGSRPGALVAATWAALQFMGREGYVNSTRKIHNAALRIGEGVEKIDGLKLLGPVDVAVVAVTNSDPSIDPYRVADFLTKKGWNLNNLQLPPAFHICCTMLHTQEGVPERFINDMQAAVKHIKATPNEKLEGFAAMYCSAAKIPGTVISEIARVFWDVYYECKFEFQ